MMRVVAGSRLVACVGCALALLACDPQPKAPPPAAGRVQAVVQQAPDADDLAGFCDVRPPAGTQSSLALPTLSDVPAGDAPQAAHWINVWATWCKPCVEELPLIARLQRESEQRGKPFRVQFVSADGTPQDVAQFADEHPGTPETARLADPASLTPFMQELGLDAGAGLPLHLFADGSGHLRCARAGAVTEDHRALIDSLIP